MANQWSQSPTRASLSVRGVAYDVEVRADEDQLQLVLEDASNGQAWSGSFAGNCMCLPYHARSYPKDSRCTKSLR
jgi:ABC-type molybdate transport system substrate-binding protein